MVLPSSTGQLGANMASYDERKFKRFLNKLNKNFQYVSDKENYGFKEHWTELPESFKGDCEDYALTLYNRFGGDLYYCKFKGAGHCILKLPCGRWIDNIQRRRVSRSHLEDNGYVIKYKYYWFIRLWKKLQAKVQSWFI